MPVTAKFVADFTDFDKGVKHADAQLDAFGKSAGRAGGELSHLALVTEQGVSPFNSLRGSLQQFDGALAAAGVHLGPEIRALGELGDVAGKSAKEVGLLGVAGLAVGAALGGWKIGRMVSEFFGLDQAIGNATAKLLGFGDVAAQTAGAKQDTINRAIANGASAMISYSDAIQFNATAQTTWSSKVVAANEKAAAAAKVRADWLKKAMAEEAADAKKLSDLQDHLFGRDLVEKARLYAEALGSVNNVSKLIPSVQTEMNKAFGAAYDALVKAGHGASAAALEYDRLRVATTNWAAINAQLAALPDPYAAKHREKMQGFADVEKAIMNQGLILDGSAEYWMHAGEIADAEMAKASAAVAEIGPVAAETASSMQQSFSGAFAGIANDAATTSARIAQLMSDSEKNMLRGGIAAQLAIIQRDAAVRLANPAPGYADGGPVNKDGLIYAHAGEYVLPKGAGLSGGASINAPITIVTSGATAAQDGRAAADALLARLKQAGVRV